MVEKVRITDSLAHETGSLKKNLLDVINVRSEYFTKTSEISPKLVKNIKEALKNPTKIENLEPNIKGALSQFGEILNNMENSNADEYQLMIEIEGLDFPLKHHKSALHAIKQDEEIIKNVQNVAKNLSKSTSFFANDDTTKQLITHSLTSFEEAYDKFKNHSKNTMNLLERLSKELEVEHKKARDKYKNIL